MATKTDPVLSKPAESTQRTIKPMTIEEFVVFAGERPDDERWELIEGVAVMSPAPTAVHQIIAGNIYMALGIIKLRTNAAWTPLMGIGTRVPVSPHSLPEPDVMVTEQSPAWTSVWDDALVLFEVLSESNTRTDQAWRRTVYASVPNCRHYVTVSSRKRVEVVRYDRAGGWQPVRIRDLQSVLDLPALGVSIPLLDLYRWTPLTAQ